MMQIFNFRVKGILFGIFRHWKINVQNPFYSPVVGLPGLTIIMCE